MTGDLPRRYTVTQVVGEGSTGVTITLDRSLPARAGQFVMVWLPGLDEKPFSVMYDDPLALTVSLVGPFTEVLGRKGIGDDVWIRGPYGHGFEREGTRPLLVGGGSGAAPLVLLAKELLEKTQDVTVALGARTADDLMLVERFRSLGCSLQMATEDGTRGYEGTVVEAVAPLLDTQTVDRVYACGPEGMLRKLAMFCNRAGIECQVSLERYMRCGIGLCGSCSCEDLLVCLDGPVVRANMWLKRGV